MENKWEILIKFNDDNKKGISKKLTDILQDENKEYNADFVEYEISVIRKNNINGHSTWGWGSTDKIILFVEVEFYSKHEIKWAIRVANALVDTLNKNNL